MCQPDPLHYRRYFGWPTSLKGWAAQVNFLYRRAVGVETHTQSWYRAGFSDCNTPIIGVPICNEGIGLSLLQSLNLEG